MVWIIESPNSHSSGSLLPVLDGVILNTVSAFSTIHHFIFFLSSDSPLVVLSLVLFLILSLLFFISSRFLLILIGRLLLSITLFCSILGNISNLTFYLLCLFTLPISLWFMSLTEIRFLCYFEFVATKTSNILYLLIFRYYLFIVSLLISV
jgi:hypothetical protein